MKVMNEPSRSASKKKSVLLQLLTVQRRSNWTSFVRPALAVCVLAYTFYCDRQHGYWAVYNNEAILKRGLFRDTANWDEYRTFYFNRSHVGLSPKEFFLNGTFIIDDQHGFFDKACSADPLACSRATGAAFGSELVTCMLMSAKTNNYIHDSCWWSSTSGSAFVSYAYVDVARHTALASGIASTDVMKFTYSFDGKVDFQTELVRHTYGSSSKTVPSGIPTTSVSHSFRGHTVSLSDCTQDDAPVNFCSEVRAYLDQSGGILPISYVKYVEDSGEPIAMLPHFDEESVYSVVQSQNLFMDNMGLDGVGTGTRPWANPLIYGRYKTSSGGAFRYGILIQVILIELLVALRALIAHPILPNDWAIVVSGLSSHLLIVIEMLVFYVYGEIYYVRNTIFTIVSGGTEPWVYGLVVCQCGEILYVVLSLEPCVMHNFYSNRDFTTLKGRKLVNYVARTCSLLAVVLTLVMYDVNNDARTSIRSSSCPGKAVSCGWRDFAPFHGVLVGFVVFGLGVQLYHNIFTCPRRLEPPGTSGSNFERVCLGVNCNAFSGQQVTATIEGQCAFPIRALCGFGFTYARNGDLFRTKDVLFYAWLLYAPKRMHRLVGVSVITWACTGQVCGKLNIAVRLTGRPRIGDMSNLAWLA